MRVYLAGAEAHTDLLKKNEISYILVSYWNMRKNPKFKEGFSYFLDSGAFSALSQNEPISVVEYGKFLLKYKDSVDCYANLDVIGDATATYANQKYLEGLGLKPIPCFHYGEPFSWLKKYVDEGYEYIALGGVAKMRDRKQRDKWIGTCFTIIPKGVKIHGFGITSIPLLKKYPFYSVDSTSWLMSGIYRNFTFWDSSDYKFNTIRKKGFSHLERNNVIEWRKMMDDL